MTNFEIITQLEDLARDAKARIDPEDSEDVFRRDYEALTEAAEILKDGKQDLRQWKMIFAAMEKEKRKMPCESCEYRKAMARRFDVRFWAEDCPQFWKCGCGRDYDENKEKT